MESATNNSKKKETRKREYKIRQKPYEFKQYFAVYGLYIDLKFDESY